MYFYHTVGIIRTCLRFHLSAVT